MDDAHLMTAVRYVEFNPVRARLVDRAEDWPWSSASAHVTGRADGLTDSTALAGIHRNWRAMLRHGLEADDMTDDEAAAIEAHIRTGRPRGGEGFVETLEARTGRALKRRKPGPKPKADGNWVLCCLIDFTRQPLAMVVYAVAGWRWRR
jgi:putative transposase